MVGRQQSTTEFGLSLRWSNALVGFDNVCTVEGALVSVTLHPQQGPMGEGANSLVFSARLHAKHVSEVHEEVVVRLKRAQLTWPPTGRSAPQQPWRPLPVATGPASPWEIPDHLITSEDALLGAGSCQYLPVVHSKRALERVTSRHGGAAAVHQAGGRAGGGGGGLP
jgi:hypothetical protein